MFTLNTVFSKARFLNFLQEFSQSLELLMPSFIMVTKQSGRRCSLASSADDSMLLIVSSPQFLSMTWEASLLEDLLF